MSTSFPAASIPTENAITRTIIAAALKVHGAVGPGLLESVYETLLAHELCRHGLAVERQKPIPLIYDGIKFPDPFRADLIVQGLVLIELKCIDEFHPVHFRQLITYLRLADVKVGLLINFNVPWLKDGIRRMVTKLEE